MFNSFSNCFHLVNSENLNKHDSLDGLIWGATNVGWLIPAARLDLYDHYRLQYELRVAHDPAINDPPYVQQCRYKKHLLFERWLALKAQNASAEQLQSINDEMNFMDGEIQRCSSKGVDRSYPPKNFSDILTLKPKDWLVDQIFGKGDLGVIYGPSGCGKTFVVIDMIIRLCQGKTWINRFGIKRPLSVAYCAGEGLSGLSARFKAAAIHHNITDLNNFQFFDKMPQLFEKEGKNTILQFAIEIKESGKPIDVLIIDTLHTSIVGADENSSQDMGKIIQSCHMAQEMLGCTIILIHHSNKNETSERGSTSLRGACDFMIRIGKSNEQGEGPLSMFCCKSKDADIWHPQTFTLEKVEGTGSVCVAWDSLEDNEVKKKYDIAHIKNEIISILREYPNLSQKALNNHLRLESKFLNKCLEKLLSEGTIISTLTNASLSKSPSNPWLYKINAIQL